MGPPGTAVWRSTLTDRSGFRQLCSAHESAERNTQCEPERGTRRNVRRMMETHVDARRGDTRREQIPRSAAEQCRRAERRGRVPRRERARDRSVQTVAELDVGVLTRTDPA